MDSSLEGKVKFEEKENKDIISNLKDKEKLNSSQNKIDERNVIIEVKDPQLEMDIKKDVEQKNSSNSKKKNQRISHFIVQKMNDNKKYINYPNENYKTETALILERTRLHKSFVDFLMIIHTLLFCIILIAQYDVYYRFNIRNTLINYFDIDPLSLNPSYIKNDDYIYDIYENLLVLLQRNSFLILDKKFEIATNIRITQRINKNDNYINLNLKISESLLNKKTSINTLEIDPFRKFNGVLESKEDFNGFHYRIENTFMNNGGFMIYFNITSLFGMGANLQKDAFIKQNNFNKEIVIKLKNKISEEFSKFVVKETSVIIIDFSVINYELSYISTVVIQLKNSNNGYSYNMEIYTISIVDKVYNPVFIAILEVLFLIITGFLLIHMIFFNIIYSIKIIKVRERHSFINKNSISRIKEMNSNISILSKKIDFDMDNENSTKLQKNNDLIKKNEDNKDISSKINFSIKILDFFDAFINFYIFDVLDILKLISLLISVFLIVIWIVYVIEVEKNKSQFSNLSVYYNVVLNLNFSDILIDLSFKLDFYTKAASIGSLFMFLRLIKNFNIVFPSLKNYIIGFRKCLTDILSFFLLFFLMILGLSLMLYDYFSYSVKDFNDLSFAFLNNIYFLIGAIDDKLVLKMFSRTQGFTIFYIVLIIIIIKYTFIKIPLAIILYHFDSLKFSKENRYKIVTVKEFKEKESQSFIHGILKNFQENFRSIFGCMICKKDKIKDNDIDKKILLKLKYDKKQECDESIGLNEINNLDFASNAFEQDIKEKTGNKEEDFVTENKLVDAKKHSELQTKDINIDLKIKNIYKNINDNADHKTKVSLNLYNNSKTILYNKILTKEDLRYVYSKFNENFEMISRNPYFNSLMDIQKIDNYYQIKYEKNYKSNIIFLFMVILLIFSILFNNISPWRYYYKQLLVNKMKDVEIKLDQIDNLNDINELIMNKIPRFFYFDKTKNESTMVKNLLLGDRIFITKKRINCIIDYDDKVREFESLRVGKSLNYENKTSIEIPSNEIIKYFEYDFNNTYAFAENGGLYSEIKMSEYKETFDNIIDLYDSIYVIEFILDGLDLDILSKYTFFLIYDYGGHFYSYYNCDIFMEGITSHSIGILKVLFVVILTILLIYESIKFSKEIIQLNDIYDKWFLKNKISASIQGKAAREHLNAEFLRKYSYILNPARNLMILVLILAFLYVILFFICIGKEKNISNDYYNYSIIIKNIQNYTTDDFKTSTNYINYKIDEKNLIYSIKNQLTSISYFRDGLDKLSATLLFLASLRMMFSINLGSYFYTINQIAIKTLSKNLMIVILLIIMMPTFIFYSMIVYGNFKFNYKTFFDSLVENFIKLFDFRNNLPKEADKHMNSLYVIVFGFTINMLILNLFVSIINVSYLKSRFKIYFSKENFSWVRIICFFCFKRKMQNNPVAKEVILNEIDSFLKSQEFEKSINVANDYKSTKEFTNIELEKCKHIFENLSWLDNRQKLMEFALMIKNDREEENSLSSNRYKNTDTELLNLQYFITTSYIMELNNMYEKHILEIKENRHKLNEYLYACKDFRVYEIEREKQDEIIKELMKFERKNKVMINDIEQLRKLKHKIENAFDDNFLEEELSRILKENIEKIKNEKNDL